MGPCLHKRTESILPPENSCDDRIMPVKNGSAKSFIDKVGLQNIWNVGMHCFWVGGIPIGCVKITIVNLLL
jgi:hypothetical protein